MDRTTGKFLNGGPFVKVELGKERPGREGRPIPTPQPPSKPTFPGIQGGTNWYSPSYSPRTGMFLSFHLGKLLDSFTGVDVDYREGPMRYTGGANAAPIPGADNPVGQRSSPVNTYTEALGGGGAVIALDPHTAKRKWTFDMHDVNVSGILTTARPDLLFSGGREGYFQALDARTGALLWKSESRRRDYCRSNQLRGGRQTVRLHCLGEWAFCFCSSGWSELTDFSGHATISFLSSTSLQRYSRMRAA